MHEERDQHKPKRDAGLEVLYSSAATGVDLIYEAYLRGRHRPRRRPPSLAWLGRQSNHPRPRLAPDEISEEVRRKEWCVLTVRKWPSP
jgi:hypothetical protein